jgi:hypothetical protein
MYDAYPTTIICLHVDNLCLTVRAPNEEEAILETVAVTNIAIKEFTMDRGLPFADDPALVVATSKKLAEHVAIRMQGIKPSTWSTVRRLGVDYTVKRRENHKIIKLPVQKQRMKSARAGTNVLIQCMTQRSTQSFCHGNTPQSYVRC